ncbi:hypothetical protein RFM41_29385 [Mesorhizobium sp. VK25A]|uniref:Uncharacterized protein n=1 Tax=Mesorhizobium vachelliae TaxID=3072309 RepID=A0ABU5A7H0_9HYPH|nr:MULTISPECIES: hypothetical protein [unclassified Mesorhizobium]MDX8532464.1 hypothetical protein [Mesorhizobium sp. VK25D]MDX8547890.1 hypothetical protein [Mesorhizobium sp. VK25A]
MLNFLFGGTTTGSTTVDQETGYHYNHTGEVTFDDAYLNFMEGGGHLGMGAAMLVGSAWTGIALTPALVLDSLQAHDGVHIA